jgi:hypothetical protein
VLGCCFCAGIFLLVGQGQVDDDSGKWYAGGLNISDITLPPSWNISGLEYMTLPPSWNISGLEDITLPHSISELGWNN